MIATIMDGMLIYGVDYSDRGFQTINIDDDQKIEEVMAQEQYGVVFENVDLRNGKIVGNVTGKGKKKTYHLPTDEGYDAVEYDRERGDMLFDTEQDALDAGFVQVKIKEKPQEVADITT